MKVQWELTPEGVAVNGALERTKGTPATVLKIWTLYRSEIETAAYMYSIPVEYIIATIATESSGDPKATRHEPGFLNEVSTPHKISVGLMQTLLSTASSVMQIPIGSAWLEKPRNSILAGTAYIRQQVEMTQLDGPKVFAAYNAGGIYFEPRNRWQMRQYPIGTSEHCDRAIKWLNDAVDILHNTNHPRNWAWFLQARPFIL